MVRAHDQLLAHRDLQFDFPEFHPPVTPQWLIDLARFLQRIWPRSLYMGYLGWAVVVAGGAIILYLVVREILRLPWIRKRRSNRSEPAAEWRPELHAARNLLKDADALAAQGRYGEAVHLLLLRSIEHICEYKPGLVRPAMTSREIGALGQLPAAARTTFVTITRVVEQALFAGRDIAAADFAQCREAYERFAFPGLWEATAR